MKPLFETPTNYNYKEFYWSKLTTFCAKNDLLHLDLRTNHYSKREYFAISLSLFILIKSIIFQQFRLWHYKYLNKQQTCSRFVQQWRQHADIYCSLRAVLWPLLRHICYWKWKLGLFLSVKFHSKSSGLVLYLSSLILVCLVLS